MCKLNTSKNISDISISDFIMPAKKRHTTVVLYPPEDITTYPSRFIENAMLIGYLISITLKNEIPTAD